MCIDEMLIDSHNAHAYGHVDIVGISYNSDSWEVVLCRERVSFDVKINGMSVL